MRTKNHAFFYRALCRVGIVAVVVGCVSLAQAVTVPRTKTPTGPLFGTTTAGNVTTVGGSYTVTSGNTGNFGWSTLSGGDVAGSTIQSVGMAGVAAPIVIDVIATVPKATAVAAIGRFMGRAIPLINTATALYQLGEELDFVVSSKPDLTVDVQKWEDVIDCTGTCYEFMDKSGNWTSSASSACSSYSVSDRSGSYVYTAPAGPSPADNFCRGQFTPSATNSSPAGPIGRSINSRSVPESKHKELKPSTVGRFVSDANAKGTWPESSALAPTLKDAIEGGEQVEVTPKSVNGPASSPGTTSQSTGSDGSVVIINTTNNYTYAGNSVTNNIGTTTTTTNPDGTTKVTSTTTTKVEESDLCKLHPESLACSELDVPEGEIPKSQKDVSYQAESIWGSGSCPADKVMTLHTGQQVKVWDFAKTCEAVNAGIAPLLLLGAAYSAFLILSLGVKDGV